MWLFTNGLNSRSQKALAQFELKLLTKFLLLFASNQIVKHLRILSAILTKANPMPGLESRSAVKKPPWTKNQPVTGRLNYNQKLGNLKELLQKGGYRDFSRKVIPLPRLGANPTLTTPAKSLGALLPSITLANRCPLCKSCFKLFSAWFQAYFIPGPTRLSGCRSHHFYGPLPSAANLEYQSRQAIRKRFVKVFLRY
jgi:hypothetical protein